MRALMARENGDMSSVREFFDSQYRKHQRCWWREGNRYSLDPNDHTAINAEVLRLVTARGPGRALDIGAGEGADSIRLAKLGYEVDAVELSTVA
jgi:2-polyprenyl-3-methyl-5-hydroxy-6-metoxy-1,4-benzoquinol methylase